MNTDYEIYSEGRPSWKPLSVQDDGEKVYIQFPRQPLPRQMPVLLIPDESERLWAVEYQLEGNVGVVNRLFNSGELKTFGTTGRTVRIQLRNPKCRSADVIPFVTA